MRRHNNYVLEASLHGIKLEPKISKHEKVEPFSREQDDFLSQKMVEAQARKMNEMRAR